MKLVNNSFKGNIESDKKMHFSVRGKDPYFTNQLTSIPFRKSVSSISGIVFGIIIVISLIIIS